MLSGSFAVLLAGVEASNLIACEWLEQLGVKAESLPAVKSPEHECLVAVEQVK